MAKTKKTLRNKDSREKEKVSGIRYDIKIKYVSLGIAKLYCECKRLQLIFLYLFLNQLFHL